MKTFGVFLFFVIINALICAVFATLSAYWLENSFAFQFIITLVVSMVLRGFHDIWRDAKEVT